MNGIEAVIATQVLDATAVGVALMTAVDAAAARSTIAAVPTARTLTINGTAFDLSADRSWTVAGGISSLNGLTDATQTFQTGTTGTNFGIVSTAGVHTFNLPDASATARGVVTTGTQTFAGAKTFTGQIVAAGGSQGATGISLNSVAFGPYGLNQGWTFVFASGANIRLSTGGIVIQSGKVLAFGNAFNDTGTTQLWEHASHAIAQRNSTNPQTFQVYNTYTNDSNLERLALQFVTYASARYAQLACESAGTGIANMNLVLSPKGTGALIAGAVPDGTTVGGNARGNNAVDLYAGTKGAATQVASGNNSFLGPQGGTASGAGAVAFGGTASGNHSFVFPGGLTASGVGAICGSVITGTMTVSGQSACAFGSGYSSVSGSRSFLVAGDFNTVSGDSCFSHGYLPGFGGPAVAGTGNFCTAGGAAASTAVWALSCGQSAEVRHRGQRAFSSGRFSASADSQGSEWVLRNKTTDGTTAVTLFLDGSSARLTIPSGKILFATAQVVGSKSDGTAVATYMRKFAVKNVGGTTTLVGSVETIGTDVAAGTSLSITADDVNDAVNPAVVGVAGETWRWVMTVYGVELAYGT